MAGHFVTGAVLRHAPGRYEATVVERQQTRSPQRRLRLLGVRQSALRRRDEIQHGHRLAEFLAPDPQRSGPRKQHVFGDLWGGNFVRTLWLASGTCLQGRTASNWIALLHERRRTDVPRSLPRFGNRFDAPRSGPTLITDLRISESSNQAAILIPSPTREELHRIQI